MDSERLAKIISVLTISPFQIVMYVACSMLLFSTLLDQFYLNTVSGIFYLGIPLIPLLYVGRKKKITVQNYSIPMEDRSLIFIVQIIGFIGVSIIYYFYPIIAGPNILFIFTVGYTILNLICLIITLGFDFKISLHLTGAASSITGLVIVLGWWWGLFYLFCIPIGWARIKLKAHTFAQVLVGILAGILIIFITYLSFGYLF